MRRGLELWARHAGARLIILDDRSEPARASALHSELVARGCRFVLGPYGSDSTRAVARTTADRVVWNHGAAADDVQRLPGVVSVPSPASRYLVALARAVTELRPGARVAVEAAPGPFARFALEGLRRQASSLGISLVTDPSEADAVLCCGPVGWERERFQRLARPGLLMGGVSPGLSRFPKLLGRNPEGMLAPVQWHPAAPVSPQLGRAFVQLDDYIAAQAYATALVAEHCIALAPQDPASAARRLRTTTFFGAFELAADGLQVGHRLSAIRWLAGRRELLLAEADAVGSKSSLPFDTRRRPPEESGV